ncbi:CU044_5270 family protein [Streptomyces sp. NPDC088789]|uniref:CU044_5270 family protein n=1 Tax=Streptomyces sp. NPDC088789 TaxID=3365899 RepID=UPI0037FA5B3F
MTGTTGTMGTARNSGTRAGDDIMARLAAARPAALDDGAVADPATRVRELATAVQADGPRPRRTANGLKPRVPARPRWAMASVSAAIAIGVTLTVVQGGGGGSGAGTDAMDSGQGYLLAAAAQLEAGDRQGEGGDFWYQEEQSGSLHQVAGGDGGAGYVIDRRQTSQQWQAGDWTERWQQSSDIGTRPASAEDERAWKAAGSPKKWTLPGEEGEARYDGTGVFLQDVPNTEDDDVPHDTVSVVGEADLGLDQLKDLPTDHKALRTWLTDLVDQKYNAPDEIIDRLVRAHILEVAARLPVSPEQRAAAYRLLSEDPKVRDLGVIEDRSGRKGNGVALPSGDGGLEVRLVLDRKTGAPLGTLDVTTRAYDGWKKGETIRYSTTLTQRWTDTEPPFDQDMLKIPTELPKNPPEPKG